MATPSTQRRWLQYRVRTLLGFVTFCAISIGVWQAWDFIPGTVRRDEFGVVQGTGTLTYFYDNGAIELEDYYRNGIAIHSTWYKPDGTVVAFERYDKRTGGTSYALHDDGTIRVKCQVSFSPTERDYLWDGPAVFYNRDGSIARTTRFRQGVEVGSGAP